MTAGVPVDLETMRSWFRGALPEALQLFVGVAQAVDGQLPDLLRQRQPKEVWQAGHKLLGSSRIAGAKALVDACEALCAAADAEDWAAAESAVAQVRAEVAVVVAWHAAWRTEAEQHSP